jgi:hypothetical protein
MWNIIAGLTLLFSAFTFSAEAGQYRTCTSGCGEGSGSSHYGAHYEHNYGQ